MEEDRLIQIANKILVLTETAQSDDQRVRIQSINHKFRDNVSERLIDIAVVTENSIIIKKKFEEVLDAANLIELDQKVLQSLETQCIELLTNLNSAYSVEIQGQELFLIEGKCSDNKLDCIREITAFLSDKLGLKWNQLKNSISASVCSILIDNLNSKIPTDPLEIQSFQDEKEGVYQQYQTLLYPSAIEIEPVLVFIRQISVMQAEKRASKYLETALVLLNSKNIATTRTVVEGFPSCIVHEKSLSLCLIIDEYFADLRVREVVIEGVKMILDFYQVCLHLEQESTLLSQEAMVFHNDCQYVAFKCQTWGLDTLGSNCTIDRCLAFRNHAHKFFDGEIDSGQKALVALVGSAKGIDADSIERLDHVTAVMEEIYLLLEYLCETFKEVLPLHLCLIGLGRLTETLCEELRLNIMKLQDISEIESRRLYSLLQMKDIEDLFFVESYSLISHYVKGYGDFKTLVQLLTWSFASIMEHYRIGALSDFGKPELVHLIKALFNDSPLRKKNLQEIMNA